MAKTDTTLIAIGGGEFAEAEDVFKTFLELVNRARDPVVTVMTVATNSPDGAGEKYSRLFRNNGIKHVNTVDVSSRHDTFDEKSLKKIGDSDALFFTGGDQLNITSLMGGSPLHQLIKDRVADGFLIAGTSAGAAMMSNSMIISGRSDEAPQVGAVEIAPGMDLIPETILDTHFSQRGRHGRLLTAIAHYPQDLGIGIDERTAIMIKGYEFKVLGEGCVTVVDGSSMKHNDLPYRKKNETVAMFNVCLHVLSAGYKFNFGSRESEAPKLQKMAGADGTE